MTLRKSSPETLALLWFVVLASAGCDDLTMRDQPKAESYEVSGFFSDGTSDRPRIPGTVSRSQSLTDVPPKPETTMALLVRGRERFDIFCTPCHGGAGYGDGMVVQRGYPKPSSLHNDRLRGIADEHIYSVIEKGLGKMPTYSGQISPPDRWAIVAYVRALQRSQHATIDDVPEANRESLRAEVAEEDMN